MARITKQQKASSSYTQAGLKLVAMLLHLDDMMAAHQQAAVHKPYVRGRADQTLTRFTRVDVQKFRRIALTKALGR